MRDGTQCEAVGARVLHMAPQTDVGIRPYGERFALAQETVHAVREGPFCGRGAPLGTPALQTFGDARVQTMSRRWTVREWENSPRRELGLLRLRTERK